MCRAYYSANMTRPAPSSSTTVWAEGDLRQNPHQAADKSERVRRMFTAIAGSYDLNNRLHSFGRDQAWRRAVVNLCKVKPTDHVLDVACGTGDLSEAFADAQPTSVTGLDFTEAMLKIAHEKAAYKRRNADMAAHRSAGGAPPPCMPTYVQGDAMQLPFDDGSFDIVSIAFGIRNVSDPNAAIAEFHRVLRPSGRLAVLEFSRPGNRVLRFFNDLYCGRIMPITASLLARDRSGAYRYLPRSVETFLEPAQLATALEKGGFTDISRNSMTFGVCTATLGVRR